MPRLILPLFVAAAVLASPLAAQHAFRPDGEFDPSVPAPRAVLGHELGERFTPHHLIVRYLERLAATSPRVRVDTVARTFEGREVLMAIVTSEANQARLDEIRRDAGRVANPRGAVDAEAAAAASRLPAIVWLGYTVHGGEASGTEAALALLYQLAAGRDEETRTILDSAVVLVDPVQNPDGHERHVQDVMRMRGASAVPVTPGAMIHSGNWPGPRTSHYYFDLNRDWFIHSHPETRGRVRSFLSWYPHVAVDLHEMGSNSTYFFAPPMEPLNKNVHASILRWWDIFAAANAAAFDRQGWSYFRREGYDEFYPGYGVSWPILTGAVGMTYEQASSSGGAIRRTDGTVLTLHQAALQHYTAAWATALTSARRARERVRDYLDFRGSAIAEGTGSPIRMIVLERDAFGRADSLVQRLMHNGIAVQRLGRETSVRAATEYGDDRARPARFAAGAWVVDLAQPQGRLAKALLEPDAQLDSGFIAEELESRRTGRPGRFYDVTAWSLPWLFRVRAWTTAESLGALEPGVLAEPATRELPTARHAYAFAMGSETSTRLLGALHAEGVRLWYAPRAFRSGTARFPRGAVLVRVAANDPGIHETVRRLASATGADVHALGSAAVDDGTDLGSNSVVPLRQPRVALLGGDPVGGNSFGFAWYALDRRIGYPVTPIPASGLAGPALDDFNVLVVPSASPAGMERVLGDAARERLAAWVRAGGVLITVDGATAWLASERLGLSRLRARTDTAQAGAAGAALPASVPGAIVRTVPDSLSLLLAGVHDRELPVLVFSDRIYAAPRDVRPGEVVLRHEAQQRLRLTGYIWPEVPARLADTPYLWTERVGRGRLIAFAGDPNFRDLWRGLTPLFANAVFFGPSF
ncbi:MAG TPA: M14 family metallopeptidase [Gemmatimonadaceae bacterium]|nr:M14 family metallopeptidase [Gemmatimonadaceae bacterium]